VDALELSKKKKYNHGNRHIKSSSFSTASAKMACPSHLFHHRFQSNKFFPTSSDVTPHRNVNARPDLPVFCANGPMSKNTVQNGAPVRREEGMPKKDPPADEMPWRCGEGCTGVNEGAIASLYAVRRLNG
jgi:hypothetical protein